MIGGVIVRKLTAYEWTVLVLGAAFLFCCSGWLACHSTPSSSWQVRTERLDTTTRSQTSDHSADGLLEGEIINLNTASRSDLLRLPNIGAVRADAILAYRDEHGVFQTVDHLLHVPGIGPATLELLRPYVSVR